MSEETKTIGISGKKRENQFNDTKYVGVGEVNVICINPDVEEYKEILGIELKEDSKATEYLGESRDGNISLRVDVWVENKKIKKKDKITFFLEDKERENKESTKKQYINTLGSCSWSDDPNNLPEWFLKREYKVAYNGEEELCNFLKYWLDLDYRDADTTISLNWEKLMKGNVNEIKDFLGSDLVAPFGALYTVKSVEKDEEVKEYQSIYNKAFVPAYSIKNFRLVDYNKEEVLDSLKKKKSGDLKPHERFILNVKSEYGCKDSYTFSEVKEYNPDDFLVASNEPIASDDPSY